MDAVARRRAGIPFWLSGTIFKQIPTSFLLMVPIAVAGYLVSWTGWFVTKGGYDRNYATTPATPGREPSAGFRTSSRASGSSRRRSTTSTSTSTRRTRTRPTRSAGC
ncbi:MAG: hypothetical protein WDM88_07355 [Galbitalea sp.]